MKSIKTVLASTLLLLIAPFYASADTPTIAVGENAVEGYKNLREYLANHIGEYVYEFNMFENPTVKSRLIDLLGEEQFKYLVNDVYQTQTPIEYNDGMFHASGFQKHMGGDPAMVWAYSPQLDAFYVYLNDHNKIRVWAGSPDGLTNFSTIIGLEGYRVPADTSMMPQMFFNNLCAVNP